jgi:hypothetical protein
MSNNCSSLKANEQRPLSGPIIMGSVRGLFGLQAAGEDDRPEIALFQRLLSHILFEQFDSAFHLAFDDGRHPLYDFNIPPRLHEVKARGILL